jgi:hypothetical protein
MSAKTGDSLRFYGTFHRPVKGGRIENALIVVFQNGKWLEDWSVAGEIWYPSSDGEYFRTTLKQSLAPGNYVLVFALNAPGLPPTHNSRKIKLTIVQ